MKKTTIRRILLLVATMFIIIAMPLDAQAKKKKITPPDPVPKAKVTAIKGGLQLNWSRSANAQSYNIYRKDNNGESILIGAVNSEVQRKYIDLDVINGHRYEYTIVPCIGDVCGEGISRTAYYLKSFSILTMENKSSGTMDVTWHINKKCSGYQVQCSLSPNFETKNNIVVNGRNTLSAKFTGLVNGSKYYVRIRCFKSYKGKKYYSTWTKNKIVYMNNHFDYMGDEYTEGEKICIKAKKYLGTPYTYAGRSKKTGFDCSGFLHFLFKKFGYDVSPSSAAIAQQFKTVKLKNAKPGDIVVYGYGGQVSHVALYVGYNIPLKEGEVIRGGEGPYTIEALLNYGISLNNYKFCAVPFMKVVRVLNQ